MRTLKKIFLASLTFTALGSGALWAEGCEGWLTFKGKKHLNPIVTKGFTLEEDKLWYDAVGEFKFTKNDLTEIKTAADLKLVPKEQIDENTCRYQLRGNHHRIGSLLVGRTKAESAEEAATAYKKHADKAPASKDVVSPEKAEKPKKHSKKKPYKFESLSTTHGALGELLPAIEKAVPGIEAVFTSLNADDFKKGADFVMAVMNLATTIQKDNKNSGAIMGATGGLFQTGTPALGMISDKAALFEANKGK